jgi:iron complex outermembrane receptor protein
MYKASRCNRPFGTFAVRSESTWVKNFRSKSSSTADWQEYVGEFGTPRWKSNLGIDWNMGNFSSTLGGRYYGGIKDRCWTSTVECSNPKDFATFGTGVNRLPGDFYFDLSVGYALPWKAKILAGANNMFDRKPRIVYTASGNYNGTSSSSAVDPDRPLDRFFYVRYNQQF